MPERWKQTGFLESHERASKVRIPYAQWVISDTVQEKLDRNEREIKDMEKVEIHCMRCGHLLGYMYRDLQGHIELRCKKCKLENVFRLPDVDYSN